MASPTDWKPPRGCASSRGDFQEREPPSRRAPLPGDVSAQSAPNRKHSGFLRKFLKVFGKALNWRILTWVLENGGEKSPGTPRRAAHTVFLRDHVCHV